MKTITLKIFIMFLLFAGLTRFTYSQKIYSCDSKYDADIKVYVVDSKYDADLLVYRVDSKYDVNHDGLWYFVDSKYDADKIVYFVDSKYDADLLSILLTASTMQNGEIRAKSISFIKTNIQNLINFCVFQINYP